MEISKAQPNFEVPQLSIAKTETMQVESDETELPLVLEEFDEQLNRTLPSLDSPDLSGEDTISPPSSPPTLQIETSSNDSTDDEQMYGDDILQTSTPDNLTPTNFNSNIGQSSTPICSPGTSGTDSDMSQEAELNRRAAKRPSAKENVAAKRRAINIEPCLSSYLKTMRTSKKDFETSFGLSKAELEKFLMDLSKSGTEGGPSDEEIELAMNETVQLRRSEIFKKKASMSVSTAATIFPLLKQYKYLDKEFEQLRRKEGIKEKIDNVLKKHLRGVGFDLHEATVDYLNSHSQSGLQDFIYSVAAFSLAYSRTSRFQNNTLFKVRKPNEVLEIPRITLFIDIVEDGGKEKWEPDYPMDVYVERHKMLTAKNFYEAFTSCYYYYWNFNLDYTGPDDKTFSDFDKVVFGYSESR